ncbi:hypothetical protein IT96_11055, partial [Listeria monocytogenes]|nr:hypothetical protein [Listeria monocytogenes]
MFFEFDKQSYENQYNFVLKYYAIILRTQQEKDRISKQDFLNKYFFVKKGKYTGKLLISKSSYKRYLTFIRNIRSPQIEPFYSQSGISKLHQVKYDINVIDRILESIDPEIIESIWSNILMSDRFFKSLEDTSKNKKNKKFMIGERFNRSGLLDLVFSSVEELFVNGQEKNSVTTTDPVFKYTNEDVFNFGSLTSDKVVEVETSNLEKDDILTNVNLFISILERKSKMYYEEQTKREKQFEEAERQAFMSPHDAHDFLLEYLYILNRTYKIKY